MQKQITKRSVDALKAGQIMVDDELRGFVVRRLPSGKLSYGFRYTKSGKRRWIAIGVGLTPHDARQSATIHAGNVAKDLDPLTRKEKRRQKGLATRTLNQVLDAFLKHCEVTRQLRSLGDMRSLLDRLVRPKLGTRPVSSIKRSEINDLLDGIADRPSLYSQDGKSRRVADKVLGVLRSAFNWHATRDDDFVSPIVKGMARTTLKELTRNRMLSDEEIRDLWAALDACRPKAYVGIVRVLLLSAARLNEVARLSWPEIQGDVFTVPGSRAKTKLDHVVPITPRMADIIGKGPGEAGDFMFSTDDGHTFFSGYSKAKAKLDEELNRLRHADGRKPMPAWRIHDLRRTARSLMSRAKVNSDVAERVLGHALPGVRGVYDRYAYLAEKRDALARLGAEVEKILKSSPGNVVSLQSRLG